MHVSLMDMHFKDSRMTASVSPSVSYVQGSIALEQLLDSNGDVWTGYKVNAEQVSSFSIIRRK